MIKLISEYNVEKKVIVIDNIQAIHLKYRFILLNLIINSIFFISFFPILITSLNFA